MKFWGQFGSFFSPELRTGPYLRRDFLGGKRISSCAHNSFEETIAVMISSTMLRLIQMIQLAIEMVGQWSVPESEQGLDLATPIS